MDIRKRRAAEAGFALYLGRQPTPSLEDINQSLQDQGLPGIRDRTFKHYRRLAQRGQRRYIPINEFDIAVKHQRVPAIN